jgi:hypothetical protein
MDFRHSIHIFVFICFLPAASVLAKHGPRPTIEPIVQEGVRYVVPNDKGLKAYVEAWNSQTGRKLWTKTVFRHWHFPIPFGQTECMHYEYIRSVTVQNNLLVITSERGRKYTLDTRTRSIRRLKMTR